MLKVRIIPCLDVDKGRVVKGVEYVNHVDAGDPVEQARRYDAAGADEICFLDITASSEDRGILYDMVSAVAEECFMPMTVGGGVRATDDVRKLLAAGADKVSIMTAGISNPDLVSDAAEQFGSQCIVVAIDAKRVADDRWEVFTHGGRNATGVDAVQYAYDMEKRGAGEILLTSMDQDGTKSGFDLTLTRLIADGVKIPLIASGGVGHPSHFVDGIKEGHASAVLAASIFHYDEFTIQETKQYLADAGIQVRL